MKIKMLKTCLVKGKTCQKDKQVSVDDKDGAYLVAIGKAEPVTAKKAGKAE